MTNHMFRAWDRKLNRMLYIGSFVSLADFFNTKIEQGIESLELFKVDYKWMQYIGIKDCNGRDIFECDIVVSQYFYPSQVTFSDGCFKYGDITPIDALSVYPSIKWEVIGNIFENPELLVS